MIDWLTYSRHVRRLPARAELDGMVAGIFSSLESNKKDDASQDASSFKGAFARSP